MKGSSNQYPDFEVKEDFDSEFNFKRFKEIISKSVEGVAMKRRKIEINKQIDDWKV
jgi:hypothetical protein